MDIFGDVEDLREWASAVVRERVPQLLEAYAEEQVMATVCEVCGSGEEGEVLLLCDNCGLGWHIHCLRPPLASVPPDDWFCPICIDYDYLDSDEEQEHTRLLWRPRHDPPSAPLASVFVNASAIPCLLCRAPSASRFLSDPDVAAPAPSVLPVWPPPGHWYCDECALLPMESIWHAQMAVLRSVYPDWQLPPVQVPLQVSPLALEPLPKRHRPKKHLLGPCRELLLAYAMELTGCLESRNVNWNLIAEEFFPDVGPKKLLKRYSNIMRIADDSHPVKQLELRRPPKRVRKKPDPTLVYLAEHYPGLKEALRPVFQAVFESITCSGCGGEVRGTLLTCELCQGEGNTFHYCRTCFLTDPLGHELTHWHNCAEGDVCSSCKAIGVCTNGSVIYCGQCLNNDSQVALPGQWSATHKPYKLDRLRKAFPGPPSVVRKAVEIIRDMGDAEANEDNPFHLDIE